MEIKNYLKVLKDHVTGEEGMTHFPENIIMTLL